MPLATVKHKNHHSILYWESCIYWAHPRCYLDYLMETLLTTHCNLHRLIHLFVIHSKRVVSCLIYQMFKLIFGKICRFSKVFIEKYGLWVTSHAACRVNIKPLTAVTSIRSRIMMGYCVYYHKRLVTKWWEDTKCHKKIALWYGNRY